MDDRVHWVRWPKTEVTVCGLPIFNLSTSAGAVPFTCPACNALWREMRSSPIGWGL